MSANCSKLVAQFIQTRDNFLSQTTDWQKEFLSQSDEAGKQRQDQTRGQLEELERLKTEMNHHTLNLLRTWNTNAIKPLEATHNIEFDEFGRVLIGREGLDLLDERDLRDFPSIIKKISGALILPNLVTKLYGLEEVTGDFNAGSRYMSFSAPKLRQLGGSVYIDSNSIELPQLERIDKSLMAPSAWNIVVPKLEYVGNGVSITYLDGRLNIADVFPALRKVGREVRGVQPYSFLTSCHKHIQQLIALKDQGRLTFDGEIITR